MSKTLFILDYDNTLLCSNFLTSESERQNKTIYNIEILPYIKCKLNLLEEEIIFFINTLQKYGTVIVLTNGTLNWVKESVSIFIPKVWELFKTIKIISAREDYFYEYKNKGEVELYNEVKYWKIFSLQKLLNSKNSNLTHDRIDKIISIGDSEDEKAAIEVINKNIASGIYSKLKVAKNIGLINSPNISKIIDELRGIAVNLHFFVENKENYISINV